MKMTFGRKFYAALIGIICLMTILMVALLVVSPTPVNGTVLIVYGSLLVTLCMMYVGGNVWNKWVKSKYFQPDILSGEEK